jgi:hypothetical protein
MKPGEMAMLRQLRRVLVNVLREGFVEQHYSAAQLAERLGVSQRTIWHYVEAYETSGGREGLGPVVKLSHKVVRIPASAINRLLKSHRIDVARIQPFPTGLEIEGDDDARAVGGAR